MVSVTSESGENRNKKVSHRLFRLRQRFWITVIVVLILLVAFLFGGDGIWGTFVLKSKVSQLQTQVDSLKAVNEQMKRKLEGLKKNDPEILEEEARSHGMVKPGEKIYLLKSRDETDK